MKHQSKHPFRDNGHAKQHQKPYWREKIVHDEEAGMPRKKKSLGQHFLRKQSVVDHMIDYTKPDATTNVLEIGCGDGFLTRSILQQTPCKALRCYEIDPEWIEHVQGTVKDPRLSIIHKNVLEIDFTQELADQGSWVIMANLPYQITFPILFQIVRHKALFTRGVVMVQEEVAQKVVATSGRHCNPTSMRLQKHFNWSLLEKIEPGAFTPPPKVFSRLLTFVPRTDVPEVCHEDDFWVFVKACYRSPRQTIRNNLKTAHYDLETFDPKLLPLRAQQLEFADFVHLWNTLIHASCPDLKK